MSWRDVEKPPYEHSIYSRSGLLISEVPELQIEPGVCPCCGELLERTRFGLECFDCFWFAYEFPPIIKVPKKKKTKKRNWKKKKNKWRMKKAKGL